MGANGPAASDWGDPEGQRACFQTTVLGAQFSVPQFPPCEARGFRVGGRAEGGAGSEKRGGLGSSLSAGAGLPYQEASGCISGVVFGCRKPDPFLEFSGELMLGQPFQSPQIVLPQRPMDEKDSAFLEIKGQIELPHPG